MMKFIPNTNVEVNRRDNHIAQDQDPRSYFLAGPKLLLHGIGRRKQQHKYQETFMAYHELVLIA